MLALNYRDSQPIYSQIKDGLRRIIAAGALEPGEKLPTVRSMAMEMALNPRAIARAYSELEDEGLICAIPGEGGFALRDGENAVEEAGRRAELMERFRELIDELRCLDVSSEELIDIIRGGGAK